MIVKKRGFTLVELLVVIAIIALLLAILLPAISKAKALAKTAVCKQHAKQVSTAWMTFATENNENLTSFTSASGLQWIIELYEYVDFEEDVFTCPVASKPVNEGNWWSNSGKATQGTAQHAWTLVANQYNKVEKKNGVPVYKYWGAYAYNRWLTPVTTAEKEHGFRSITAIEFPSSTAMFAESINRSGSVTEDDELAEDFRDPGGVLEGSATGTGQLAKHSVNRHGNDNTGRLNVSFMDSSVSTLEITEEDLLINTYWHKDWDTDKVIGGGGSGGSGGGGGGVIF